MDPFECTLVLNPSQAPASDGALFWPAGRSRLVLLFEILTDKIIVRGIDPDVAEPSVLVFRVASLLLDQKDRFVQAVREGLEPTRVDPLPVSNENRDPVASTPAAHKPGSSLAGKAPRGEVLANAIVIIDRPGDDPGPKMYVLQLPGSGAARATGTQG
jgi:hypothetical protein